MFSISLILLIVDCMLKKVNIQSLCSLVMVLILSLLVTLLFHL